MSETGRKDEAMTRDAVLILIRETQDAIARKGGYANCARCRSGMTLLRRLYQLQEMERASR